MAEALLDIDELASKTGLAAGTLRSYSHRGIIPCTKINGKLRFDLKAVATALGERGNRTRTDAPSTRDADAAAEEHPTLKLRVNDLLLWDKHVAKLGWAIGQVREVYEPDDFAELLTDAGATAPCIQSALLQEIAEGKLFVLEPGAVIELLLCQLAATPDAPQRAVDALGVALKELNHWKETTNGNHDRP
jgi:DNA-binding transcriptional MerR regulator